MELIKERKLLHRKKINGHLKRMSGMLQISIVLYLMDFSHVNFFEKEYYNFFLYYLLYVNIFFIVFFSDQ